MNSGPEPVPSRVTVGIVVAKRRLSSPWADHAWQPAAVLPAAAAASPWTRLTADERQELYYAGAFELAFHPSETSHYRDNLTSGQPSLWVALRLIGGDDHEISVVTADPYEGESLAGTEGEVVEAVPMPPEIQAHLAAFIEAFHVERVFVKRKRDRADSEALARRMPGPDRGTEET